MGNSRPARKSRCDLNRPHAGEDTERRLAACYAELELFAYQFRGLAADIDEGATVFDELEDNDS